MSKSIYILSGALAIMYVFHFALPESTDVVGKWTLTVEDAERSSIEISDVYDGEFKCRITNDEGWNKEVRGKISDSYIEIYDQLEPDKPWMRLNMKRGFFGNVFGLSHSVNGQVWYRDS